MKLMRRKNNVLTYLMLTMLVSGILCGEVKAQTPIENCEFSRGDYAIAACTEAIRLNDTNAKLY